MAAVTAVTAVSAAARGRLFSAARRRPWAFAERRAVGGAAGRASRPPRVWVPPARGLPVRGPVGRESALKAVVARSRLSEPERGSEPEAELPPPRGLRSLPQGRGRPPRFPSCVSRAPRLPGTAPAPRVATPPPLLPSPQRPRSPAAPQRLLGFLSE